MYIFSLHHLMTDCKLILSRKYLHVFPENKTSFIDTYARLNKIRKLAVIYCITQPTEFFQFSPYCSFSKRKKKILVQNPVPHHLWHLVFPSFWVVLQPFVWLWHLCKHGPISLKERFGCVDASSWSDSCCTASAGRRRREVEFSRHLIRACAVVLTHAGDVNLGQSLRWCLPTCSVINDTILPFVMKEYPAGR